MVYGTYYLDSVRGPVPVDKWFGRFYDGTGPYTTKSYTGNEKDQGAYSVPYSAADSGWMDSGPSRYGEAYGPP